LNFIQSLITKIYLLILICFLFYYINFIFNLFENKLVVQRWKSFAKDINLIYSKDTEYQNVALGFKDGQYNIYLNGVISNSFPDPYSDALLIHSNLIQHKAPKKVLLIGLSSNNLIREALNYDIERIDFIELIKN